jgi:tetraacyldisaccharide 4'-kinase
MLRVAGWLYGKITDLRNSLYDRGVMKSHSLGARTISIGNLSFGGTGKTPLVAHVAEILARSGEKVCVLTRGYGRKNPNERVLASNWTEVIADQTVAGDEPFELAHKLLGKALVISDPDRVSAARWAIEEFGITAFVLDDGFQHRKARRDVDIVCIDATDPFRLLREPVANISRADAVVVTRAQLVDDLGQIEATIGKFNASAPVFRGSTKIISAKDLKDFLSDQSENPELDRETPVFAFAGLANTKAFVRSLEMEGFAVVGSTSFTDHVVYTAEDMLDLENFMRRDGGVALVTTAKDAVKLGDLPLTAQCFVIEIEVSLDDEAAFRKLITSS